MRKNGITQWGFVRKSTTVDPKGLLRLDWRVKGEWDENRGCNFTINGPFREIHGHHSAPLEGDRKEPFSG